MNRAAPFAAAILAMILLQGAATADPLAPARGGALQCYDPRPAHKTCASLASYTFQADGTIQNEATVLISPEDFIVMKTVSPVEVRGEAVCGPIREQDIKSAIIIVHGVRLPPEQAVQVRVKIAQSMESMMGKEVCTTYQPYGDQFYAHVTVDGAVDAGLGEYVRWVSPDDGYRVAP